ncbi:cupin domain-containing protein [Paraburkholderia sp. Tr-20389]|uniref:cupin domain-containing protein n=1 Tax=Paraburkholderia sp. Tr-20389 TaxID=2703903 RepID=UPI0019812E10|nr:cupin domain-containing protein [Paraburkholderia sp. Tr-20389]MBN3756507.1 cupin domain-containing protein [Paraburkholderia sp. Tr-20389]
MKPQPLLVVPQAYARALNVLGEKITVLADHAATQGYEVFLQRGPEGSGPPPHSHDWDESFFVIDGSVEFVYGGTMSVATAGSFVHIPAGTVHSFRCGPGGVEMLSITSHTSQASNLFAAIDREVTAMPPDVSKLVDIGTRYGARLDA